MKKQILILTFLSLAFVFAGMKSYGQNLEESYLTGAPASCPTNAALTNCGVGNPLNPVAGVTYTYEISHTGGATGTVQWIVTDDLNVMAAGGLTTDVDLDGGSGAYILDAEDGVYNNTSNTSTSIDISWNAFDGATTPVLLVAYVTDAVNCTDNVEVWRIEPQYSFTLEIVGLHDDGTLPASGTNAAECVSPVVSATYDGANLTMDYGENYIYYLVSAANFIHSWTPTFAIDATGTSSTVTGPVEWAYADEANLSTTVWNGAATPVLASHYTNAVNNAIGSDGACIVLRVLVDHGGNEIATANESVIVSVDGDMYNLSTTTYDNTYPDLDDSTTSGDPCVVGSNDSATYDLTPRPDVNEVTPAATSFEPKN